VKLLVIIQPILDIQHSAEPGARDDMPLIRGEPWVKFVIDALPRVDPKDLVFVISQSATGPGAAGRFVQRHQSDATVVNVPMSAQGAGCAALMASDYILDQELCVVQGNQLLGQDALNVLAPIRSGSYDGGLIVFESLDTRWPHVRLNSTMEVEEASESVLIGPHALAGVYYYRSGNDFVRSLERMIRKGRPTTSGYGLAHAVNEMILAGKRIGSARIASSEYVPLERDADLECYSTLLPASERIATVPAVNAPSVRPAAA
jgi:hypothetical protein